MASRSTDLLRHRGERRLWSSIAALVAPCVVVAAGAAHADVSIIQETVYQTKKGSQLPETVSHRYWLGSQRARLEQESEVYLVDTEAGELYYVDLEQGHFDRHPSPNTLENRVPAIYLEQARTQMSQHMPKRVEVTRTGETEEISGYEAERVVLEAGGPGEPVTARFELWVSRKLWQELADTAYWALERDRLSMSPYTAWLVEPLRKLEAVPVKRSVSMFLGDGRMTTEYTTTVLSVREGVVPPDGTYRIPEGLTPFPPPEPARSPP